MEKGWEGKKKMNVYMIVYREQRRGESAHYEDDLVWRKNASSVNARNADESI